MGVTIEDMRESDWEQVRSIFIEGIATGHATFETDAPDWETWNRSHLPSCRVVARGDGSVAGWGAVSPVSERCVYGGVGEVSVYVAEKARGKGIGKAILLELVKRSEIAGLWTLQAGVFPENVASIVIHEACGFRRVGVRERLGQLHGVWRDVILLERRSTVVGVSE